ncbi:Asp-tRNA(Asn)/Glu-tRNA(Gln) amidotransferase subunit GatA, partial [Candidatus Parcubacteria bacterium]|nr:Asp-tRNA(Asn)/Glu-tRNA(Gln) amidotransferase subunit GatA [Candidatus Parcubacteria bacterium]
TTAFELGEKTTDPLEMYLADVFTVGANIAGICGLSLPIGSDNKGLPIGLQLLAKQNDENSLFILGNYIEQKLKT